MRAPSRPRRRRGAIEMTLAGAIPRALAALLCASAGAATAQAEPTASDIDTEADCRWCHCNPPGDAWLYLPNRHHRKVGQPIPGSTTGATYDCLSSQCHTMTWNEAISAYDFVEFRDCIPCHRAPSSLPDHHRQPKRYACTVCHACPPALVSWCGRTPG
jgi:hypothetical protein